MSEKHPHVSEDFQVLVRDVQRNELSDLEEAWVAEREKAKALRKAQQATALNATELIGVKTRKELLAEHDRRLDEEDREAEKAAAARMEDTSEREHQPFPPPVITVK